MSLNYSKWCMNTNVGKVFLISRLTLHEHIRKPKLIKHWSLYLTNEMHPKHLDKQQMQNSAGFLV